MRRRGRRTLGFTVIELVAVIVILGSLVATVAPRYASLADDAHQVVVAMTAAAFGGSVRQAYYGCVMADFAGKDNLPRFGDGTVDFNANCLPSSTNGNNSITVNGNRCVQIWNGLLASAPAISTLANDVTDYRAQGSGPNCTYTYREDEDDVRRFRYNAATGSITILSNP